ncbi:hypothetical protein [Terrihabitans rhizophilus]|uniref:Uncharacterized protein n=1 Tax=Terrihabitans rhizophilus TaxID=3092662 RepID=A0ABU4RQK4_9HYPH|nr:hypothetical protein [Terrihabitans sp. PJ23]MDX6807147.1 hypothetical protein [Terrihabitans sp. PJ23]
MAITIRRYLFEENGDIKFVPRRTTDALVHEDHALPQYANTRQRIAEIVVENESGRAVQILDAVGRYWSFSERGQLQEDLHRPWALNFSEEKPHGKVVDLQPAIKRREWEREHRWDVMAEDLDRIAGLLRPDLADDGVYVKSIAGAAPKKPPLTSEARSALRDIRPLLFDIEQKLARLSEPALKGLAFEARQVSRDIFDPSCLYAGLAAEADRQREIKARHRTGKGVWYAVLHVFVEDDARSGREVDTVVEACKGQKAAAEAGQRLLAANAYRFSERTSLQVRLYSDLEWPSEGAEALGSSLEYT